MGSGQYAVGNRQLEVGSCQWSVGSRQWVMGSGQYAVGSMHYVFECYDNFTRVSQNMATFSIGSRGLHAGAELIGPSCLRVLHRTDWSYRFACAVSKG